MPQRPRLCRSRAVRPPSASSRARRSRSVGFFALGDPSTLWKMLFPLKYRSSLSSRLTCACRSTGSSSLLIARSPSLSAAAVVAAVVVVAAAVGAAAAAVVAVVAAAVRGVASARATSRAAVPRPQRRTRWEWCLFISFCLRLFVLFSCSFAGHLGWNVGGAFCHELWCPSFDD
jgi:nitrate reductase NapE component